MRGRNRVNSSVGDRLAADVQSMQHVMLGEFEEQRREGENRHGTTRDQRQQLQHRLLVGQTSAQQHIAACESE